MTRIAQNTILFAVVLTGFLAITLILARAEEETDVGIPCGDPGAEYRSENCPHLPPKPVASSWRPWQEIWQCNDLRVTVTGNAPGMVNYDIAGSVWGGINFTFDGPRHQLYTGQWQCALVR